MIVKICGIKRSQDAQEAIRLGADRVGILVGQKNASNDFLTRTSAEQITESLNNSDKFVLVTHLTDIDEIIDLAKRLKVKHIQLHGDSSANEIYLLKKRIQGVIIIKSLQIVDETSIEHGKQYLEVADEILLDTINEITGQVGGTGQTHDWNISREIVNYYKLPVTLAGGLTPENVQEAIKIVSPTGVDVNSGVTGVDGFKDIEKLRLFISRAKGVKLPSSS